MQRANRLDHLVAVRPGDALSSLCEQFPSCSFACSGHSTAHATGWQPLCHADGSECDAREHLAHEFRPGEHLERCRHGHAVVYQEVRPGDPVIGVDRYDMRELLGGVT